MPVINVRKIDRFRIHSKLWGDSRTTPLPFDNKWLRLHAAGKALKLSRAARGRLEWIIWYETTGGRNARLTCRHFGIAPKVFYFWRKRFSETLLETLEDRSHRPKRVRQSTLTSEQIDRIVALRQRYLRYSKLKLAILYRERYGEPISSWKIQQVIEKHDLYPNPVRTCLQHTRETTAGLEEETNHGPENEARTGLPLLH